ncbi:La-related protein 1 [Colletotrichum chlorophyti]|uniref:La-related protein 1 n=1 Tax=Colletotrichum chlorophyti TaxID=708187 RepID=A0A1Q8RZ78_9PEZI|nr:La-related protein 1 [Colletotrichum chlorophyti]
MRAEYHIDDIPYPEFRIRALSKRQNGLAGEIPGDMVSLYRFWSHFLARHFDLEMFEEFRACAMADARGRTANTAGLRNLIAYYEAILQKVERPLVDNIESLYHEAKELAVEAEISRGGI